MKKLLALILSSLILCTTAACSSGDTAKSSATTAIETTQETTLPAPSIDVDPDVQKAVEETFDSINFKGVVYAVKDGKPLAAFAKGTLENGEPITIDSPMPVGSISKQFCAAAILLLQEQGKLSVDDTLDKYYPEYEQGDKITLKNLLSMRSGVPTFTKECIELTSVDKTDEENTAIVENWIFSQELDFEPDDEFSYSNSNYFLLGNIVEQVSGEKYIDFLRENFFEPLGMTNTGSIGELSSSPEWAQGITYQKIDLQPGLTKGAGDLISNAADIQLWLEGLHSGKVISPESYEAMTTDYTDGVHYGYGLFLEILGGVGHSGVIGSYTSYDYINEDEGLIIFMASNNVGGSVLEARLYGLIADLTK